MSGQNVLMKYNDATAAVADKAFMMMFTIDDDVSIHDDVDDDDDDDCCESCSMLQLRLKLNLFLKLPWQSPLKLLQSSRTALWCPPPSPTGIKSGA